MLERKMLMLYIDDVLSFVRLLFSTDIGRSIRDDFLIQK